MIKKIAVLTSGGDAPGMNACIRAVVRSGLSQELAVYGVVDGYKGLWENRLNPLYRSDVSDILLKGGTILGTARLPEFKDTAVVKQAAENLKAMEVDGLVAIGGDGTYRGALALAQQGIACVALPSTIDNDLPGCEYCIGFDTALNTIIQAIDKLRDTSSSHHRCSIV